MDGMYGLHPAPAEYSNRSPDNLIAPSDLHSVMINPPYFRPDRLPAPEQVFFGSIRQQMRTDDGGGVSSTIKSQIASHPRYPSLLQAYIDCHKVGAPPEIAWLLDEMMRENVKDDVVSSFIGDDPELDEFMETYCDILVKCKSDLSRPFDEATAFLNKIESNLSCLCNPSFVTTASDDGAISSDEEYSVGYQTDTLDLQHKDQERDLKDRLLRRFGSQIGSLKMEFCKKKKKGKLPREAKQTLLEWWNSHCKWPYPTEDDKITLAETTGLDQRQINNWFINQRKRHWKPSENMQFALMH